MNNFYEKYRGIINLIIICVVIVFVKTFILTDKKSSKVSQEIKDDLIGTVEQAVEMLDEAQKENPDFEKYKFENEGLIKDPSNNHEKELIFLTQGLQKFLKEDAIYTQKYQKNSLNIDDLLEIKVLSNQQLVNEGINKIKHNNNEAKKYVHQYKRLHSELLSYLKANISKKTFDTFQDTAIITRDETLDFFSKLEAQYQGMITILNLANDISRLGLFEIDGDNFYITDDVYLNKFNNLIEIHNNSVIELDELRLKDIKKGKENLEQLKKEFK